jgi:NAD(P)-dependent dehydrogenase (short-subunit alcohol dehydrogenase family)
MTYRDRAVVVTGGTGALGTAVVGALLAAGAVCHVPYIDEQKIQRFPHRDNERVKLVAGCDLADEAGVARLFDGIDDLWASIHLAGGFAMSPLAETDKAGLMAMIDTNLVSCYLCCRAAIRAMARHGAGGRIVNVAARHALEPRTGAGMTAYTVSKAGVAARTEATFQRG